MGVQEDSTCPCLFTDIPISVPDQGLLASQGALTNERFCCRIGRLLRALVPLVRLRVDSLVTADAAHSVCATFK